MVIVVVIKGKKRLTPKIPADVGFAAGATGALKPNKLGSGGKMLEMVAVLVSAAAKSIHHHHRHNCSLQEIRAATSQMRPRTAATVFT